MTSVPEPPAREPRAPRAKAGYDPQMTPFAGPPPPREAGSPSRAQRRQANRFCAAACGCQDPDCEPRRGKAEDAPEAYGEGSRLVAKIAAGSSAVQFCQDLECFGWRLLVIMATGNLLGGMGGILSMEASPYLYRTYHTPSTRMAVFVAVTRLPFACQVALGLISDMFPICGFRKAPLMILTGLGGVCGYALVWLLPAGALDPASLTGLLLLPHLQRAVTGVLIEAQTAEKIREFPKQAPSLTAYWMGLGMIAQLSRVAYSFITHNGLGDVRAVYGYCCFLALPVLAAACMNFHGEERTTPREAAQHRARVLAQPKVLAAGLTVVFCAILLAAWNCMGPQGQLGRLILCLVIFAAILGVLALCLPPTVARVNIYQMIAIASGLNIRSASFYFYTDDAKQYPRGPHFDPRFFNSVLGGISICCSIVGLCIYVRYMKGWKYRSVLACAPIARCLGHLPDLALFSRANLALGIPDHVFVLGSEVLHDLPMMWSSMPIILLIAKSCPAGMEATMFSLLASCAFFSMDIANYLGAVLLAVLGIDPRGAEEDSAQFQNLWMASLVCSLLPLLPLALLPVLIPDVRQTDAGLEPEEPTPEGAAEGALKEKA